MMDCAGAQRLTGLSYTSLARFRHLGTGPDYIRTGAGRIYYTQEAIIKWMAEEKRFYADGSFGPTVQEQYEAALNAEPPLDTAAE